jgi:hypothetical protein
MTSSLQIRSALVESLELDLVVPRNDHPFAHELLPQFPQRWYLTSYLIPKSADEQRRSAGNDELDLEAAVSECLWHGHASLKVINGYGSTGGASRIRPHVLHALQKHADYHGGKVTLDGQNPGAHVLWLR